MKWFRQLQFRLRALFRKDHLDARMDDEMRSHIEMQTRENLEAGMSPEEARRAASRQFGFAESIKETCREQRGVTWLETLVRDLRHGSRMLRKHPGFTAVALLTLMLGIGANTAIFSVVNGVLLRPLPFHQPDELVIVWGSNPQQGLGQMGTSFPNFRDWREQNTTFGDLAAANWDSFNITVGKEPERLPGASVSANFFSVLGVKPIHGRAFLPGEDEAGRDNVVVLGQPLWERAFGGDTNVLGKALTLNGKIFTVVGVMPSAFRFPFGAGLWTPLALDTKNKQSRGFWWLTVIGRLKPDATLAQAQTDMDTVAQRLAGQYPETHRGWGARLVPVHEQTVGDARNSIWLLFLAGVFVLLIASANVANLQMMRAAGRQREFSLRAALGASRGVIIRQLVAENLLLFTLGGVLGFILAHASVESFMKLVPSGIPRIQEVRVDGTILLFTLGVSIGTGVLFGLLPALRGPAANLCSVLNGGGKGATGDSSRSRARQFLVVAEVALALMLLVAGGLLLQSFWGLQRVSPGFDSQNVLAARLTMPQTKYADARAQAVFYAALTEKISNLPGVESVGMATTFPLSGGALYNAFVIEGRANQDFSKAPSVLYNPITPDYFRALRIPLLQGRFFTSRDDEAAPPVVIINRALARRFFAGENPLGQRIRVQDGKEKLSCEIIGVTGDVRQFGPGRESQAEIYLPFQQRTRRWMTLLARTGNDPLQLVSAVRRAAAEIDPDQPLHGIGTLRQAMADSVVEPRFRGALLAILAFIALALSAVGIYGVLSFAVAGRVREIGVRTALGAQRGDILAMVLREGLRTVLAGVVVGLMGAAAMSRALSGMLFGVGPFDLATLTGVTLILTVVAVVACLIPARRATHVQPMVALRHE